MKRTALFLWFVAVSVLLAANSYVCYVNVRKLIDYSQAVSHARDVIFALDATISSLKDAETGERGFVLSHEERYLDPYEKAMAVVNDQAKKLDDLVNDDSPQQERVDHLRKLIKEKVGILETVIGLGKQKQFDAARDTIVYGIGGTATKPKRNGKDVMDDARGVVEGIRATETADLDARSAEREAASKTAVGTLIGAGVLNVILLLGLGYAVRRDLDTRAAAADARERAVRLTAEVDERRKAADVLTAVNQKLEVSNRELQDFAYVASHDLQEPLRKIQAFGDRLRSRFADALGQDGKDYVERMHNAANRMQVLINDLLTFARVTTKALPFTTVDLGTVARDVVSDLEARLESSGGRVELAPDLPAVEADPTQLRQVIQNLISNALKFRKPDVAPIVRVSATPLPADDGERPMTEIAVADNGIGFDEKYLDRIFNVFQRLHGRQQYEGTGIGLAVVRKIVERHGGTVTARSREGEGATFVFTLPLATNRPPAAEQHTVQSPTATV